MGKHSKDESTPAFNVRNSHPGCTWNIFHVLKYNHWRNIKRRLPHKKRNGGKSAAEDGNPGADVAQTKTEDSHTAGSKMVSNSSAGTKSSVRARLIALITYEMSRRKGRHQNSCPVKSSSQLIRSDSFRRLEIRDNDPESQTKVDDLSPSPIVLDNSSKEKSHMTTSPDTVLLKSSADQATCKTDDGEECTNKVSADVMDQKQVNENGKEQISNDVIRQDELNSTTKQTLSEEKLVEAEELRGRASLNKSNENMLEAQDVINMNNELIDILQDPSCRLSQQIYSEKEFSAQMELTKSNSFLIRESLEPDKCELKPEGSMSHTNESMEDICNQSESHITAEHRSSSGLKVNESSPEIIDLSSSVSAKPDKGNGMVIKRFKDLKEKIRHVMKEGKKEKRITMDAILDKIPRKQGFSKDLKEDVLSHVKDLKVNSSPTSSNASDNSDKKKRDSFKRTVSVDQSLERYTHLYEVSFNREVKENFSEKSEPRIKDDHALPSGSGQKCLERISSSPELSYSCTGSPDNSCLEEVDRSDVCRTNFDEKDNNERSSDLESLSQLDATIKNDLQETNLVNEDQEGSTMAEIDEALGKDSNDSDSKSSVGDVSLDEQDGDHDMSKSIAEQVESTPLTVDDSLDAATGSAEVYESEDAELTLKHKPNEPTNLQHESTSGSPGKPDDTITVSTKKVEIHKKLTHSEFLRTQVDAKDKAKFDYVKEVLELSGFSRTETLGAWHSDNQPLDTAMCTETEGCVLLDPNCSGNEEGGTCIHLVYFDLINELLLEIWENSYAYYPKPLSALSHIRPMPVGYYVLEQVWGRINWYLSSVPGSDQLLDYVVSRDLAKNDGWMNLQFDMECVGFELEEMIFDDLLEEITRI
ncbi:hypothetical protein ACFE04_030701 [Oxalis oulophora]